LPSQQPHPNPSSSFEIPIEVLLASDHLPCEYPGCDKIFYGILHIFKLQIYVMLLLWLCCLCTKEREREVNARISWCLE
jgi:hypothetical protein